MNRKLRLIVVDRLNFMCFNHGIWMRDMPFFLNILNVVANWANGLNELWGIWGTF